MNEFQGPEGNAKVPEAAQDQAVWKRLWTISEERVGYQWTIAASPSA